MRAAVIVKIWLLWVQVSILSFVGPRAPWKTFNFGKLSHIHSSVLQNRNNLNTSWPWDELGTKYLSFVLYLRNGKCLINISINTLTYTYKWWLLPSLFSVTCIFLLTLHPLARRAVTSEEGWVLWYSLWAGHVLLLKPVDKQPTTTARTDQGMQVQSSNSLGTESGRVGCWGMSCALLSQLEFSRKGWDVPFLLSLGWFNRSSCPLSLF